MYLQSVIKELDWRQNHSNHNISLLADLRKPDFLKVSRITAQGLKKLYCVSWIITPIGGKKICTIQVNAAKYLYS